MFEGIGKDLFTRTNPALIIEFKVRDEEDEKSLKDTAKTALSTC